MAFTLKRAHGSISQCPACVCAEGLWAWVGIFNPFAICVQPVPACILAELGWALTDVGEDRRVRMKALCL